MMKPTPIIQEQKREAALRGRTWREVLLWADTQADWDRAYFRIRALVALGRPKQACADADRVLSDPSADDGVRALALYACSLTEPRAHAMHEAELARVVKGSPLEGPRAWFARLLASRGDRRAGEIREQLLASEPRTSIAESLRAAEEVRNGHADSALRLLERINEEGYPLCLSDLRIRLFALRRLGKGDAARRTYLEMMQMLERRANWLLFGAWYLSVLIGGAACTLLFIGVLIDSLPLILAGALMALPLPTAAWHIWRSRAIVPVLVRACLLMGLALTLAGVARYAMTGT